MSETKEHIEIKVDGRSISELAEILERELHFQNRETWNAEQDATHLDLMVDSMYIISARILDIGNTAAHAISNGSQNLSEYKICYEWGQNVKSFLVLWRNIIFEEQKALIMVSEGKAELKSYQALKESSRTVFDEASANLLQELQAFINLDATETFEIQKLSLQTNPWEVYKQQIASIAPQSENLIKQYKSLWNSSGIYVLVKSNIEEDYTKYREAVGQFKISLKEMIKSLEFSEDIDIGELVKQLSSLNNNHLFHKSFQEIRKQLSSDLKELPQKDRYVIKTAGSGLAYEEIDIKQRTEIWLDSELLPLINNICANRDNIKNQFNLSLSNIKNRLTTGREEGLEFDKTALENALTTFIKRLEKSEQQIGSIRQELGKQLQQFAIHNIYKGNFLNLSMASTLNQYGQNRLQRFEGVKKWIAEKGIFLKRFQDDVQDAERLSLSEKLVRVINARKPRSENHHYTNMFTTRGYIGDSFMVGRSSELAHIKSIIDNWLLGYRGAVMITGTRFSGKTLLAEVISQRHFTDKTIKLVAGKKLQVGGRHLDPTMDLGEQLDFIVKYSLQDKVLVYLDDLHQWHNEDHSLLKNMRAMTKAIDRHSNKLFFLVCLNNWQKERLNIALNIDGIFQAQIKTDSISVAELNQAILIRHTATHTELVDKNGEEVPNKALLKNLNYIHFLTKGNIGESLHRWAQDIEKYDDDKVMFTPEDHTIPNFLNPSISILLKTIMMYGSTNEYNLRRLFGPAFTEDYKPILQRMINVGVIVRNINGKLEIRNSIVNDIAALLEKHTNFTYTKKSNIN